MKEEHPMLISDLHTYMRICAQVLPCTCASVSHIHDTMCNLTHIQKLKKSMCLFRAAHSGSRLLCIMAICVLGGMPPHGSTEDLKEDELW